MAKNVVAGRKGVSPLIAAVLLIAFTMAVAAILTAWVTTFTKEQTQQLGNKSEEQIDCGFGGLNIFETTSYGDAGVQVAIENSGTVDFSNVSVTVLNNGVLEGRAFIANLSSSQIDAVNVTNLSGMETVRVATSECPQVSAQSSIS